MANIMNPAFPIGGVERSAPPAKSTQTTRKDFSEQLDRRISESNRSQGDKVGVKHRDEVSSKANGQSDVRPSSPTVKSSNQTDGYTDINGLLALYMQDLQQISQSNDFGMGEWVVPAEGLELMQSLAENAGMEGVDLSALMAQAQNDDGELDLPSFFQALETYFSEFETEPEVLVPETELPLLESLLAKMGVSEEQLAQLSEKVVVGDGKLDLGKLSEALAQLEVEFSSYDPKTIATGAAIGTEGDEALLLPVTLSDAELELLQGLLGKAGLNLGQQIDLIPEQLFAEDVVLSFDRLQAILGQSVNQAKADFSKIDLIPFLKDMEGVMEKATFAETGAGLSPILQNSIVDVYKNLIDIFDDAQSRFDEGLALDESLSMGDVDKWRAGVAKRLASLMGIDPENITVKSGLSTELLASHANIPSESTVSFAGAEGGGQSGFMTAPEGGMSVEQSSQQAASNEQPKSLRHFSTQQQQQIFNQLSLAVARGVKTGEHHLTLRLYPAELGDVKVDIVMKGDEISAHFNLASSRVKETLESSMDEFRQEMEQKGFNLGELNVSVGGQDDPREAWQRFEMAWTGEQLQAETLEDVPHTTLYSRAHGEEYVNEQGVNIFI